MTTPREREPSNNVLSEAAAVEVLAYLVSAARTQLDEAAEYAPMRLLTGARKLADHLQPSASAPVAEFIAALSSLPPTATPSTDRVAYVERLDAICVALAECLLALDHRSTS